jgi:hypothetical protein
MEEIEMALKAVLDNLDGLDAGITKLYVQKDGKFHLDVESETPDGHAGKKKDDAAGGDPPDTSGNWIPKNRFNQLNEQKKSAEAALAEVVTGLKEDIPEELRDLIPAIAPAEQIKWIRDAQKKGLFTRPAGESGPDSKRPGGSSSKTFEGLPPQAIMAQGYKTK